MQTVAGARPILDRHAITLGIVAGRYERDNACQTLAEFGCFDDAEEEEALLLLGQAETRPLVRYRGCCNGGRRAYRMSPWMFCISRTVNVGMPELAAPLDCPAGLAGTLGGGTGAAGCAWPSV